MKHIFIVYTLCVYILLHIRVQQSQQAGEGNGVVPVVEGAEVNAGSWVAESCSSNPEPWQAVDKALMQKQEQAVWPLLSSQVALTWPNYTKTED